MWRDEILTAIFIFFSTWLLIFSTWLLIITSTSDLQSSTAIANQSLGKSVLTYLNHNDATTYL